MAGLLVPENFDLQNEMNAARYAATQAYGLQSWFAHHYAHGSSGDPQRQAGYSGGFDPRYTDAGNYGFGLSAKAGGLSLESAIDLAMLYTTGLLEPARRCQKSMKMPFAKLIRIFRKGGFSNQM